MILGLKLREESTVIERTYLFACEEVPWPVWGMQLGGEKTPHNHSMAIIAQEIAGHFYSL
jgi:hypothetical protein